MAGTLRKEIGINWVWLSLTVLWERWFPEEPSFEMLDDKIQEGYRAQTEEEPDTACRIWLKAWHWLLWILERHRIPSVHDFDERFRAVSGVAGGRQRPGASD